MAIDPDTQRRISEVVIGIADALRAAGVAVGEAALDAQDLALELDTAANKNATVAASDAIERAMR